MAGAGGFGFGEMFGGRRGREEVKEPGVQVGGKSLEEAIAAREKQLSAETTNEDVSHAVVQQVINDERIIESVLLILLMNENTECELIPCIQSLIKLQSTNGIPVFRNKFVNAVTFLLKSIS